MDSSTPVYRQTCVTCDRPALTLGRAGGPYRVSHANMFIAAADVSAALSQAEMSVLLVHRTLATAVA